MWCCWQAKARKAKQQHDKEGFKRDPDGSLQRKPFVDSLMAHKANKRAGGAGVPNPYRSDGFDRTPRRIPQDKPL